MKPKVLHLLWDEKFGGVNTVLDGFMRSSLAEDFDFEAVVLHRDRPVSQALRLRADLIVYHPPCRLKFWPGYAALRPGRGARLIVHEHAYSEGFEQCNAPFKARFRLMLQLFYGLADQVVAISHAQSRWMLARRLVEAKRLTVITQCPPLDRYYTVPPRHAEARLVLGAYGRFCRQKGFDVLIDAMRRLDGGRVQLLIGGAGEEESALREAARGLDHVAFLGRLHDVPAFLALCDAVVIPSRWEPWGNVCLEARAAGRAVIASAVDGLPEQVGSNGLLVPPGDPKKLAEAITSLVVMPEKLAVWAGGGRAALRSGQPQYIEQWRALMWRTLAG